MPKSTGIYTSAGNLRQIRVPINPQPISDFPEDSEVRFDMVEGTNRACWWLGDKVVGAGKKKRISPLGNIGDLLYSKEAWAVVHDVVYKADNPNSKYACGGDGSYKGLLKIIEKQGAYINWRSAKSMPKKYARYWYKITNLTVGLVQEITYNDIQNSGIPKVQPDDMAYPKRWFIADWNTKHPDFPFESNCYTWIAELERTER